MFVGVGGSYLRRFLRGYGALGTDDDHSGCNRAYFAYHLDDTGRAVALVEVRTLFIDELCAVVGTVEPTCKDHSRKHRCFSWEGGGVRRIRVRYHLVETK